MEEIEILGTNQAVIDQHWPIDNPFPEIPADEDHAHAGHLPGLKERQGVEQFVERAKSAWERNKGFGSKQEMHFPEREVAKLKT